MTPDSIIDLFRNSMMVTIILVSVIIIPGLAVGLLIAIFQAATQINESTLNFVPKLLVTFLVLSFLGPWLLNMIVNYSHELIMSLPDWIG